MSLGKTKKVLKQKRSSSHLQKNRLGQIQQKEIKETKYHVRI